MDYISSILTYAVSKISKDSDTPSDPITSFHFFSPNHQNLSHLYLGLSYERGFEVWDFQDVHHPDLHLSIRNSGVKKLLYYSTQSDSCLILLSLYSTLDFSTSSFQVFSLNSCKIIQIIEASQEIENIETKGPYLIISTIGNFIEVYQNLNKTFVVSPNIANPENFKPVFGLSQNIFAFTYCSRNVAFNNVSANLFNLASSTLESIMGQSTLIRTQVYNQVNVVDIASQSKIQNIHAFEVAVSFICFSESGKLMFLCPEHGQSFHVYRFEDVFKLSFSLYRGVSLAKSVNVAFSAEEDEVVVTSSKGTCHVYELRNEGKGILYKQPASDRLRLNAIGCYFKNNDEMICVGKTGSIYLKSKGRVDLVFEISRLIDFKCKIPIRT